MLLVQLSEIDSRCESQFKDGNEEDIFKLNKTHIHVSGEIIIFRYDGMPCF